MAAYFFKMNEHFWHGALFLWQLQHFMSIGCLRNTIAMVTFTRFFCKIIAYLIEKICYYASRMNDPSLKDSKKLWFLTLFKCVLLSIEPNVVRFFWSARGPYMDASWKNSWHEFFCFPCPSYAPEKIRMKSGACHILWIVHARVLKFHK